MGRGDRDKEILSLNEKTALCIFRPCRSWWISLNFLDRDEERLDFFAEMVYMKDAGEEETSTDEGDTREGQGMIFYKSPAGEIRVALGSKKFGQKSNKKASQKVIFPTT